MFNQHQNSTWKKAFPIRNLVAWSAAPLLLFPARYTGEDGYISDTEQSDTIDVFGTLCFIVMCIFSGIRVSCENQLIRFEIFAESTMEKKGNKENYNDSAADEITESAGDFDKNVNANAANNASITSFIINRVNDHATIQRQSSEQQHTEL